MSRKSIDGEPTASGREPHELANAAVALAASPLDACRNADVLCILTEWPLYREVAPAAAADVMTGRAVVDTRNLLDRAAWNAVGFTHEGVGR